MEILDFFKKSIFVSFFVLVVYTIILFIFIKYWRFGFVFICSTVFGFGLKYGELGYAVAFRELIKKGSLMRIRTLFVIFFVGTLLSGIITTSKAKALFNRDKQVRPNEQPIGISLLIGSFVFGFGMNLAGCCASGTLVGVGSGSIKAVVTFLFFICGSTVAMTNGIYNGYNKLPKFKKPTTVPFYVNLIILCALIVITYAIDYLKIKKYKKKVDDSDVTYLFKLFKIPINSEESSDNVNLEESAKAEENTKAEEKFQEKRNDFFKKLYFSMLLGAIIGFFYLCCGSMIGISGIFADFGGNFLKDLGLKVDRWDSFKPELKRDYFNKNIFNSDIYIMIGAFIAVSLKQKFGADQCKNVIFYIKAACGGFLMGIGAKMSYGCNIGSMTSGICSNSLHGYIWMIFCTLGVFVSIFLCTIMGIEDEKPKEPKDTKDEKKEALVDDSQENIDTNMEKELANE